jgi:cytochrome P450
VTSVPSGPRARFPGHLVYALRSDPLRFLTRTAQAYGDFVPFRLGRLRMVLVNDPEAIREVLVTNDDSFTKSPALRNAKVTLGEGLLTSEGDFHRRQRRLSQPAFHPQRVASYGDVFVRYADEMTAKWSEGQTLDVHDQMMEVTLRVVAKTLFDAELPADIDEIGAAMDVLVKMFRRATHPFGNVLNRLPLPSNFRFLRALSLVHGIIDRFIAGHRRGGVDRGDLLSMLMRARDAGGEVTVAGADDGDRAGGMTDKQLRDELFTLFTAGHETTANALTFTSYLLARHPQAEAALHEEVDRVLAGRAPAAADVDRLPFTRAVLSESMRLYPPAWIVTRQAKHDVEIAGRRVAAGQVVMMSQWVTHRDERWWPQPHAFRPERWLTDPQPERPRYAYFPFGGGARSCIGEFFARTEATLIIAAVARRWRMRLVDASEPALQPTITLRPRHPMRVIAAKRSGPSADKPRAQQREKHERCAAPDPLG